MNKKDNTELRSYYDVVNNIEYINLAPYLVDSCREYNFYVYENELHTLSKKEKNILGTNFILNQVLQACNTTKNKKCFFYQEIEQYAVEALLVRRIFNALPSKIIYNKLPFDTFLKERDYYVLKDIDVSTVSFSKFRTFLKKMGLVGIEKEFLNSPMVKLSLLP